MISEALLAALIAVESAGNPLAIGDNGRSYGCLQIRREVVLDVNRATGSTYRHADAFDPVKAKQIARAYLERYGKNASPEKLARIWNGGPAGYKRKATVAYWQRVKRELNKQHARAKS